MPTEKEIMQIWKGLLEKMKEPEAVAELYRLAKENGANQALDEMEKELVLDETIESALKTFGWSRGGKSSLITTRAVLREAASIAKKKIKSKK